MPKCDICGEPATIKWVKRWVKEEIKTSIHLEYGRTFETEWYCDWCELNREEEEKCKWDNLKKEMYESMKKDEDL